METIKIRCISKVRSLIIHLILKKNIISWCFRNLRFFSGQLEFKVTYMHYFKNQIRQDLIYFSQSDRIRRSMGHEVVASTYILYIKFCFLEIRIFLAGVFFSINLYVDDYLNYNILAKKIFIKKAYQHLMNKLWRVDVKYMRNLLLLH